MSYFYPVFILCDFHRYKCSEEIVTISAMVSVNNAIFYRPKVSHSKQDMSTNETCIYSVRQKSKYRYRTVTVQKRRGTFTVLVRHMNRIFTPLSRHFRGTSAEFQRHPSVTRVALARNLSDDCEGGH